VDVTDGAAEEAALQGEFFDDVFGG